MTLLYRMNSQPHVFSPGGLLLARPKARTASPMYLKSVLTLFILMRCPFNLGYISGSHGYWPFFSGSTEPVPGQAAHCMCGSPLWA